MNEELFRHLVLLLLAYVVAFLFVLTGNLLDLESLLGTVVLGTALAIAVIAIAD